MITAKFGKKVFEVKSNKIYTPSDLKISESLGTEEIEVTKTVKKKVTTGSGKKKKTTTKKEQVAVAGKKPKLSIKTIGLQSLSFSIDLDCRFVSVENEIRYWKNILLGKKSDFFYLGSYQVGKFFLTQYDVDKIILGKNGAYSHAVISLTFTEDGNYANSKKINFTKPKKVTSVKKSNSSTTSKSTKKKTIKIGTKVKPKKNTRWYSSALNAINRKGKYGKASQTTMRVKYIYQNGKAINLDGKGWMLPKDVTIL